MSFTKSISDPSAQIVTFTTTLPFATVQSRLEAQIHKATSVSTSWLSNFQHATSAAQITAIVNNATQGGDFLYFTQYSFSNYLRILENNPTIPNTITYEFGNPLIAATIVSVNLEAALFIPPRMLLREIPGVNGAQATTSLSYYLPSSLLKKSDESPAFVADVTQLDIQIEQAVLEILD